MKSLQVTVVAIASAQRTLKSPKLRQENQGRKRNPNPNFFGPDSGYFPVGYGVFHVKGWGAKKFGMSLETREIKLGYPGGARNLRERKVCVQFSSPRNRHINFLTHLNF